MTLFFELLCHKRQKAKIDLAEEMSSADVRQNAATQQGINPGD